MRSSDRPRRREREGHQPADGRLRGDLAPAAAQRRPQLQTVYHPGISPADRPRQTADRGQDRGTINSAFVLYLDVFAGVKWSESPRRVPCALLDPDRVGLAPLDLWAPTTRTRTSPDPLVDHNSQYCFNVKSASGKWLMLFAHAHTRSVFSGGPPGGQYPQGWGNTYQQWQPQDPSE